MQRCLARSVVARRRSREARTSSRVVRSAFASADSSLAKLLSMADWVAYVPFRVILEQCVAMPTRKRQRANLCGFVSGQHASDNHAWALT